MRVRKNQEGATELDSKNLQMLEPDSRNKETIELCALKL